MLMKAKITNILTNNTKPKPKHPVLLVLGDGLSMPDDLGRFLSFKVKHDAASLGRSYQRYPGLIRHWFNADGTGAKQWAESLPQETIKHSCGDMPGFDVDWEVTQDDYHHQDITGEAGRLHGTSSIFAALAAIEMGYGRIVLAGCPLDTKGHWHSPDHYGPSWFGMDFMAWLDFAKEKNAAKVRSMSGYTARVLGSPDKEWLCTKG